MEVMKEVIGKLQENIEKSNGSIEEMQCIFYETAKELMNDYVLKIGNVEVELKELEFYYYDDEKHKDNFTHGKDLQKECCVLYVHEKWGNYGGIDITFGNGKYYGGILIRGAKINGKYVAGPVKFRNYLRNLLGDNSNSYSELQDYFTKIKKNIYLIERENYLKLKENILVSIRHGLGKKGDLIHKYALYRFISKDYIDAQPSEFIEKNNKKNSLQKDIFLIKLISSFTKVSDLPYEDTRILNQNIKLFKQKLQNNECIKNKGTK